MSTETRLRSLFSFTSVLQWGFFPPRSLVIIGLAKLRGVYMHHEHTCVYVCVSQQLQRLRACACTKVCVSAESEAAVWREWTDGRSLRRHSTRSKTKQAPTLGEGGKGEGASYVDEEEDARWESERYGRWITWRVSTPPLCSKVVKQTSRTFTIPPFFSGGS